MRRGTRLALGLLLAAGAAHAQAVGVPWRTGQSLHVNVGLDPVPLLGAQVSHALPLPGLGLTALDAGADLPVMLLPSLNSWRVGVGARSLLYSRWRLGIAQQTSLRLERVRTRALSALSPTAELRLQLGHFSRAWQLAAELGYRQVLASHLRFPDAGEEDAFAGGPASAPREGWYRLPAGYFLVGAVFSAELQRGYYVGLRFNLKRTSGWHNPWEDLRFPALALGLSFQMPLGALPAQPRH